MKKLIIHIGMHKTGSTSIQETCYKSLKSESYVYLDLGAINHNHIIYSLFCETPKEYYLNKNYDDLFLQEFLKDSENNLKNKLMNCNHDNVLISGEDIINLPIQSLNNMKIFFEKYFKEIEIIAYVREPKSYMTSLLQQVIKSGVGFQRFLDENSNLSRLNLDMLYPQYRQTFEKFENIFGRNNVILKYFDKKSLYHEDVVLDFFYTFGIDVNKNDIKRSNDSISKNSLSILYSLRKYNDYMSYVKLSDSDINLISHKISEIEGDKLELSEFIVEPLLKKYKDDIEWLQMRLGISLKSKQVYAENSIRLECDILNISEEYFSSFLDMLNEIDLPEIKKIKIKELVHKVNILNGGYYYRVWTDKNNNVFSDNKINILSEKIEMADILRDLALYFENIGDIETAYKVMDQALFLRKRGPFINKKLEYYRSILKRQLQ